MTIRGTSNQTAITRTKHVVSVLEEVGAGPDEGGAGFPHAQGKWITYIEADNDPSPGGTVFTKGSDVLSWGTPQVDAIPV